MDSNSEKKDQEMAEVGHSLLNKETDIKKAASTSLKEKQGNEEIEIEVDTESPKALIYGVDENPPIHLTVIFALQQLLLVMSSPVNNTLIIAEVVCMQSDEFLKLHVLCALMFITGVSTFLMVTIGVRLPIFQGATISYIIPLIAMTKVKEWACPATFKEFDAITNTTILMTYATDNTTAIPARDLALGRISELSGSLMAVGAVHFLLGLTGVVGVLLRFIGPITIVPTIVMIGLNIFPMVVKFMEPNLGISFVVVAANLIFSLLLGTKKTPIPWWNKKRGFHIFWYPLHSVFSILISMVIGWVVSVILTKAGALTDDPEDIGYLARSDARNYIIEQSDWFILSYPGKFGSFSVNPGVFANFLIATMLSILDSIGDYAAAARVSRVSPPPHYAFNRGIAVEGLMSFFAGTMGCCTSTVSYGSNIGAMGITRVVSRRVFQVLGLLFIVFSVVGKIGAFFITIPYPVLGGTTLITIGLFIGVVLSYLQTVDLTSTRNLAILGISLLFGLVMPHWVSRNGESINTGNRSVDLVFQMLLANASLVAGLFACVMDNIVPGTLKERGIAEQMKDLDEAEDSDPSTKDSSDFYQSGSEVYRIPYLPQIIRRSTIARKFLPIFDYYYTKQVKL